MVLKWINYEQKLTKDSEWVKSLIIQQIWLFSLDFHFCEVKYDRFKKLINNHFKQPWPFVVLSIPFPPKKNKKTNKQTKPLLKGILTDVKLRMLSKFSTFEFLVYLIVNFTSKRNQAEIIAILTESLRHETLFNTVVFGSN